MTDPNESTWARDLTVLREVVRQFQEPDTYVIDAETVQLATALDRETLTLAAANLKRGGYVITGETLAGLDHFAEITERALRETGVWPNQETGGDALLWALEQKVEEADTPEARGKWTKIRDAVVGAGRDYSIELAAALTTKMLGG